MPKSDNRRKKAKLNAPKKRVFRAKVSETDGDRPKIYQGTFEAPCGSMVAYTTPIELPTLQEYRREAITGHITSGECPAPDECATALGAGEF